MVDEFNNPVHVKFVKSTMYLGTPIDRKLTSGSLMPIDLKQPNSHLVRCVRMSWKVIILTLRSKEKFSTRLWWVHCCMVVNVGHWRQSSTVNSPPFSTNVWGKCVDVLTGKLLDARKYIVGSWGRSLAWGVLTTTMWTEHCSGQSTWVDYQCLVSRDYSDMPHVLDPKAWKALYAGAYHDSIDRCLEAVQVKKEEWMTLAANPVEWAKTIKVVSQQLFKHHGIFVKTVVVDRVGTRNGAPGMSATSPPLSPLAPSFVPERTV